MVMILVTMVTITTVIFSRVKIYMSFAGWEVRIVKNCDRGLENAARSIFKTEITVFHYTDRPKPVNNFFFSLSLKRLCLLTEKNSRKRYCDRGQR